MNLPLFSAFPGLRESLPYAPLGQLPTPVEHHSALACAIGMESLWIKRDDLSGDRYGGNKVRKLEFVLADAQRQGAREVLTFGFAGSNHALCTAYYARKLGMRSISMLMPQPNSHVVRNNLLFSAACSAELHLQRGVKSVAAATTAQLARHRIKTGKLPVVIPGGGSSALGVVGFVNAAFELRRQIDAGAVPQPDLIYLAVGSMGSAAGLLIGTRVLGAATRIEGIRVVADLFATKVKGAELANKSVALLCDRDASFPNIVFEPSDFPLRDGYFGEAYGLYTKESAEALALVREHTGIPLEGTYTGKAFAALADDARSGRLKGKTVLFWNTYNSWDFTTEIADADFRALPRAFHQYFVEEVQPLDTPTTTLSSRPADRSTE